MNEQFTYQYKPADTAYRDTYMDYAASAHRAAQRASEFAAHSTMWGVGENDTAANQANYDLITEMEAGAGEPYFDTYYSETGAI